MEINYLVVFGAAILSMVIGSLWYSPLLFGKAWMRINRMPETPSKDAMKEMYSMYAIQFVLSFLQAYILAHFVKGWTQVSGVEAALWVWLGFVMPTIAMAAMWTTEPTKDKFVRFGVQAGFNLVLFVAWGYIFGVWG